MTDLDKLIEAVKSGTVTMPMATACYPRDAKGRFKRETGAWSDGKVIDAYDGSLDAARWLHEALLPRCGWEIWRTFNHMPDGTSPLIYGCNLPRIDTAYAENPARAWLLAVLTAVKAGAVQ